MLDSRTSYFRTVFTPYDDFDAVVAFGLGLENRLVSDLCEELQRLRPAISRNMRLILPEIEEHSIGDNKPSCLKISMTSGVLEREWQVSVTFYRSCGCSDYDCEPSGTMVHTQQTTLDSSTANVTKAELVDWIFVPEDYDRVLQQLVAQGGQFIDQNTTYRKRVKPVPFRRTT